MPIYEYECENCGKIVEAYQRFSEKPLKKCEYCAGRLNRLISQSTFHLKGTGWYVTDYGKGSGGPASTPENKTEKASKTPAKDATKKSDSATPSS
jgi:putative FmdB family regulatory protein